MNRERLLEVLRASEQQVQNFSFHMRMDMHTVSGNGDRTLQPIFEECTGVITTEEEPRYRFLRRGRLARALEDDTVAYDGPPIQVEGAFNGAMGWEIHYDWPKQGSPASGIVSSESNLNQSGLFTSGFRMLLPFFCQIGKKVPEMSVPRGLVYYLENVPLDWGEWHVEETESSDTIRIVIPYPPGKSQLHDVVEVDLSRGCSIVGAGLWKNYGDPDAQAMVEVENIILEEKGRVWLPTSLDVFYHYQPAHVLHFDVEYAEVNAALDESAFSLTFPPGLPVHFAAGLQHPRTGNGDCP